MSENKTNPAEQRRDLEYAKAKSIRDDKREQVEQLLCDAMNSYRSRMMEIENEYFEDLDIADRRCERALRAAARRRKS